jgi:hypothetical protein
MQKRILVVSHDQALRESRSALLLSAGYAVSAAGGDDEAMALMVGNSFDVVLIGRNSRWPMKGLDERVRELHLHQPIVKIARPEEPESSFCSRITDSVPAHVLEAVREVLLGAGARAGNGLAAPAPEQMES